MVYHKLVAKHVKIDPVFCATTFGKAEFYAIKFACFRNVANGDGNVEGG